MTEGVWSSHRI